MIPRYRGKVSGGRRAGHRRRHRLAIMIEIVRVLSSLAMLYAALVCAIGLGLWLANTFNNDLSDNVAGIPVLRQLAIQSDLVGAYGDGLLAFGFVIAVGMLVAIHLIANLMIDDLVNR